MNHKSIRRIILIATLTLSIFLVGCAPAIRHPKIIALGFVNAGFEISVLDLSNSTRQYVTNSHVIAPTSYSYCESKKQVAYSAFVENGEELIFQDLNNARTEALTQGNNHFRFPVWSPDCSRLAFTSYDNNPNVLILNLEDSQTRPAISSQDISYVGASWSPDSHFLATYIPIPSKSGDNPEGFELGIVDVTTNNLLNHAQGFLDYPFSDIAWNANSRQFYFSANRDAHSFDIYAFDLDENIETPAIKTEFDDRYPLLSPDGKYLSFLQSSSIKDTYNLGLFELSSENTEFIIAEPEPIFSMFWLDSQRIIFSEYNLAKNQTIYYIVDIKTKTPKEISRFDGRFIAPKVLQP